jgi:acyl dehydratase
MSTPIVIEGLAGLKSYVGKELGASDWQTLSYEDIVRFADATGDHQWIHVDRARIAKESPFGAPVAHGYFTLSRIAGLFFEVVQIKGFNLVINYGLNKVRFPNPLKEGKRYRLVVKMNEVSEVKGGAESIFAATMEIEGEPKPACAAEVVFRYLSA